MCIFVVGAINNESVLNQFIKENKEQEQQFS